MQVSDLKAQVHDYEAAVSELEVELSEARAQVCMRFRVWAAPWGRARAQRLSSGPCTRLERCRRSAWRRTAEPSAECCTLCVQRAATALCRSHPPLPLVVLQVQHLEADKGELEAKLREAASQRDALATRLHELDGPAGPSARALALEAALQQVRAWG